MFVHNRVTGNSLVSGQNTTHACLVATEFVCLGISQISQVEPAACHGHVYINRRNFWFANEKIYSQNEKIICRSLLVVVCFITLVLVRDFTIMGPGGYVTPKKQKVLLKGRSDMSLTKSVCFLPFQESGVFRIDILN